MQLDERSLHELNERARWDDHLGLMLEQGWPLTKASYLAACTMGEGPDFPLDPELRSTIPRQLEGKVPRNAVEYDQAWALIPPPKKSTPSPTKT